MSKVGGLKGTNLNMEVISNLFSFDEKKKEEFSDILLNLEEKGILR